MKQLFFFLIASPIFFMAQTTDSTKQKRFAIGINFSPDYSYRNFIQPPRITDNSQDYYSYNELPKYGYTTGLSFDVNMGKRFTLETGVLFADKGVRIDETFYDQIYSNGTKDIYSTIKITLHHYFLDIPLKANINILLAKRFKLYISTGAVFNIALGYKNISEITYPNSPSKNYSNSSFATSFQSPFGATILLGMGASYDLNKKITVKIEPIYRQSLNSTFPLKSNGVYYSIGTNVGVSYRF